MKSTWRIASQEAAQGRLPIDDMRLEYQVFGPAPDAGAAPTLILLHEGLGCVAMWKDFPQHLSEQTGCGVFAYSRAGYGASSACTLPRPLDYMQTEGERCIPKMLDALNIRSCVLVGHSDGASIAAVSASIDARIHGLILMAPHFFTEDLGLQAIARAKTAYDSQNLRERLRKYHGANVDCAFRGWNDAWLHADFRNWDLTHYLPKITVPILAIQGQQDPYGSQAQVQALRQYCAGPVDIRLLDDCMHAPFKDQTEQTMAAITAWLSASGLSTLTGIDADQNTPPEIPHTHGPNPNHAPLTAPEN
jgi:pimeloyl-ACP methyl ester carboxylesterase